MQNGRPLVEMLKEIEFSGLWRISYAGVCYSVMDNANIQVTGGACRTLEDEMRMNVHESLLGACAAGFFVPPFFRPVDIHGDGRAVAGSSRPFAQRSHANALSSTAVII